MMGGGDCPKIARALGRGDHDQNTGDVTKLQTFLTSQGYFHDPIDGVFGASTQTAVKAFQTATGVAIGGNPSTNGFGAVGPKTRMMIEKHCGDRMGGGDEHHRMMGSSTAGMMTGHGDCVGTTTGTIMGRPCPMMGDHGQGGDDHRPWMGTTTPGMMGDGDHHGPMMPPPQNGTGAQQ